MLLRLLVPTIVFVNKLDRVGADAGRTVEAVARRLDVLPVVMAAATGVGTTRVTVTVGVARATLTVAVPVPLLYIGVLTESGV